MKKLKKVLGASLALLLACSLVGCKDSSLPDTTEEPSVVEYGLKVGNNSYIPFTQALTLDTVASDVVYNSDGTVSYIATASGGAGGGLAFYFTEDIENSIINTANYDSVDIEIEYSPVENKWNSNAMYPGFCFRVLPTDSTGIFGGAVDVEYFDTEAFSGSYTKTIDLSDVPDKVIASSDYDGIKGFCIKFNDYQRNNTDGDQLSVTIKKVIFNKKAGTGADVPFDDGLTENQRGIVQSVWYPTKDYTMQENPVEYEKHAWVYLPAGYDANNTTKKYPVFILVHGFGQNENTWGLSDIGNGGKIKGYMDRGMADGSVKPFILVVATGVASQNWGPNGSGNDFNGFNAFGGELRNDLLPYIYENYNCIENRENTAFAGLSMGGGQTLNIALGNCLDLFANFGAFSPALFSPVDSFITDVEANFPNETIKTLYMICGDADYQVYASFPGYVNAFESWNKVENFSSDVVPGGTHDFPVWYQGFRTFITKIFKD